MEELKYPFNQEMSEADISEALELLKEGIKRGVITYTNADPVAENCYISSGYISGLYFPNSQIVAGEHSLYNFRCIAKVENKLQIIYELNEEEKAESWARHLNFREYIKTELKDVIYSYEERQIQDHISSVIKHYKEYIKTLESVERVRRTNGQDFQRLEANFKGARIGTSSNYEGMIQWVDVNGLTVSTITMKPEDITADFIECAIIERIKLYREQIKKHEKEMKNVFSNYKKMLKIKKLYNEFAASLGVCSSIYTTELKRML